MEIEAITNLIGAVGFPIAACIFLGLMVQNIFKKNQEQSQRNMEQLQQNCTKREEKLFNEIAENRKINGEFAVIIGKYDVKLNEIQNDVKDIKQSLNR